MRQIAMASEVLTVKDKAAIVGLGETKYYKRGGAPFSEFRLACEAIIKAAEDAGIAVRDIDGLASYAAARKEPIRMASALGLPELRLSNIFWSGGGGGVAGAIGNAAAAIAAGYANYVCVFRALAQGQFYRFGSAPAPKTVSGNAMYTLPYGMGTAAQMIALRTRRFMHEYQARQDTMAAVAMASYYHAQFNP